MKILSFCAYSWRISCWITTGTRPITSPPVVISNIDLDKFQGNDVLYIRLHGIPGEPFLYGDGFISALSMRQIESIDLTGTEVFMEGCFGALLSDAFLNAGAKLVIGSDKPTFGRRFRRGPSSHIGSRYLKMRKRGLRPQYAFDMAVGNTEKKDWRMKIS